MKRVNQEGPTCGIYAIASILEAYSLTSDVQKTASKLHGKAVKQGSTYGEFMNVNDLYEFIKRNCPEVNVVKVAIDTEEDLRQVLNSTELSEPEAYVIVPYYSKKGIISYGHDFRHYHYGVCAKVGVDIKLWNTYPNSPEQTVNAKKLFKSNKCLTGTYSLKGLYVDNIIKNNLPKGKYNPQIAERIRYIFEHKKDFEKKSYCGAGYVLRISRRKK